MTDMRQRAVYSVRTQTWKLSWVDFTGSADDDDEDSNGASSLDASPKKGAGAGGSFLATHSGAGRGMCAGAAYARRVSSLRREDDGGSPAVLMQETSLLEALGPRVSNL